MQSNIELRKALLPHLFLFLKLPTEESPDFKRQECALLCLFSDFLKSSELLSIPELSTARQAFSLWAAVQSAERIDAKRLAAAICELSTGGHLPLFIREQNAGLLISVPSLGRLPQTDAHEEGTVHDDYDNSSTKAKSALANTNSGSVIMSAVISTFPASLPAADLFSNAETPNFSYPSTSVRVSFSPLLKSEYLAEQISRLDATKHIFTQVCLKKKQKFNVQTFEK